MANYTTTWQVDFFCAHWFLKKLCEVSRNMFSIVNDCNCDGDDKYDAESSWLIGVKFVWELKISQRSVTLLSTWNLK